MFKEKLSNVPKKSGCYLMKNSSGVIIYVGKAKILFNRLKSYFTASHTGKTAKLVSEIASFEYIVTSSETEAFILELNLIKKYDPKYNILLKDDKTYPYIELTNEKYPRLIVKREVNINKKNKHVYGPYPSSYSARRIVNLLNRLYPLRKCEKMPKKVCLYYHIGECLGYCENKAENYENIKNEILSILSGNDALLINKINEKIKINSESLNFEVCKELKEELDYMKNIFERQKVELDDNIDRDIFNYYLNNSYLCIYTFFIRNGKLVGSNSKILPIILDTKETLESYIVNFYSKRNIKPKEIIVPLELDINVLSNLLETKVINVQKGKKKKLFDLCKENAKITYENDIKMIYNNEQRTYEANEELKNILKLDKLSTIEAFDNSNLFGTFTVSAMVSFKDGLPDKKNYRKFKLSFEKNDDIAAMKEVIYRRYFRLLNEQKTLPDLIIVDGATNQINACKEVLDSLNLKIKIIGVKKDNHHSPSEIIDGDTLEIIQINKRSNLFYLLSRIDEEVHRFAINYHKEIRSKGSISSVLDNINGLGEIRKKKLIKKYGSVAKIKETSVYELSEIIPLSVAETLHEYLNTNNTLDKNNQKEQ